VLAVRQDALARASARLSDDDREALVRIATKVLAELVSDPASALATSRLCDYAICPDAVCPAGKALAALSP
jgi:hypothetical protein